MEGNSGGGGGGGGGNDVELLCKTLQVEHKLFYFDLKENPRGRYLKISEKTSATRSTIIVPFSGISWFLDLFNYYVNSDDQDLFSKELQLDTKVFYFDIGENRRGRFLKGKLGILFDIPILFAIKDRVRKDNTKGVAEWKLRDKQPAKEGKSDGSLRWNVPSLAIGSAESRSESSVSHSHPTASTSHNAFTSSTSDCDANQHSSAGPVSEASVSRNRSTIIVPAGSSRDEGWAAFRNILAEINEASRLFILPNQQNSESSEHLVGLSDDVGAGFISGHSTQPATSSELNVDRSVDLPPQDEIGNLGVSKVIRADQKRFFFDLGSNNRGHFLRISEVAGSDRSSIILPLSGLKQFHEIVGHFVEITKDRIEGMAVANVRTIDPPQR
ncbi:Transcription factor Pur-alpha 1 [Glycine soja]